MNEQLNAKIHHSR